MDNINSIYQAVLEGNAKNAKEGVNAALQEGLPVNQIMQEGLIAAMSKVGQLYEDGECFVPEMLIAARAMLGRPGTTPASACRRGSETLWSRGHRHSQRRSTR